MKVRTTQKIQDVLRSVACKVCISLLLACVILFGQIAVSTAQDPTPQSDSPQSAPTQIEAERVGLRNVVKIIFEPGTNYIRVVGSSEDIAVIRRTLESLRKDFKAIEDPTVTEKVILKSQMAETVATIMSNSIAVHAASGANVKIIAVHHPEAILLVGPASAVKRAKQLLATIDRYKGLSTSDPPVKPRID